MFSIFDTIFFIIRCSSIICWLFFYVGSVSSSSAKHDLLQPNERSFEQQAEDKSEEVGDDKGCQEMVENQVVVVVQHVFPGEEKEVQEVEVDEVAAVGEPGKRSEGGPGQKSIHPTCISCSTSKNDPSNAKRPGQSCQGSVTHGLPHIPARSESCRRREAADVVWPVGLQSVQRRQAQHDGQAPHNNQQ